MPVRDLAADSAEVRDDAPLEALLGSEPLRRLGALMAVDADGRLRGVVTSSRSRGPCRLGSLRARASAAGTSTALGREVGAARSGRPRRHVQRGVCLLSVDVTRRASGPRHAGLQTPAQRASATRRC